LEGNSPVTFTEISQLQNLLLQAVLLGTPLPGASDPVRFPDLPFVTRQANVIVLDENLSGPITISMPVRVLSADAIRQEAEQRADVVYFQFAAPRFEGDQLDLTLAARIAPHAPASGMLGLSSIHARFHKVGDQWQLVGEPIYSAA
jgi:hypothetical protein